MKLFSWAQKKLLPSHHQHNADHVYGASGSDWTCEGERGIEAPASKVSTHGEVLTIGTLGLGNLLSREEEEEEEQVENEEEEEEEERVQLMCGTVDFASPNCQSASSNRASTSSSNHASTSSTYSYRASVSSNRESVSSVDIQKLQDELQKILYFKLGQEHEGGGGKKSKGGRKAKEGKQKKQKSASGCYIHDESHVSSETTLPLHSFLEMPMDHLSYQKPTARSCHHKFLNNTQCLFLMQSLKAKFLHFTSPTRVSFSTPFFEKLAKPKVPKDLQHGNTMDKMLHLLRKIMNKRPYRRSNNGHMKYNCEEDKKKCIEKYEVEEQEEVERLKLALARSFRGSDKFINYITSIMEHTERSTDSLVNEEYLCHHPYQLSWDEESHLQLLPTHSPCLKSGCWIKTDDEYFVLEL